MLIILLIFKVPIFLKTSSVWKKHYQKHIQIKVEIIQNGMHIPELWLQNSKNYSTMGFSEKLNFTKESPNYVLWDYVLWVLQASFNKWALNGSICCTI